MSSFFYVIGIYSSTSNKPISKIMITTNSTQTALLQPAPTIIEKTHLSKNKIIAIVLSVFAALGSFLLLSPAAAFITSGTIALLTTRYCCKMKSESTAVILSPPEPEVNANAPPSLANLPQEFYISGQFTALSTTFSIRTNEEYFLAASIPFFSPNTLELRDTCHVCQNLLATAKSDWLLGRWDRDVADPSGRRIGRIECNPGFLNPEFKVFNREERCVAIAKIPSYDQPMQICDPNSPNNIYAEISLGDDPFFVSRKVEIRNRDVFRTGKVDPCLLITLVIDRVEAGHRGNSFPR